MRCFCCDAEMPLARKVKVRRLRQLNPARDLPGTAAYLSYQEQMTFRWAVVCQGCFQTLDNELGVAEIGGQAFNLGGASRRGKATVIDEEKYRRFQRREAEKLGLDLAEDEPDA